MVKWSQNDALFLKELEEGHAWQYLPALFLQLHKLEVIVPELKVRDNIKEARKFKDTVDLLVNGKEIEVKSRNEAFTSPESFPYPTVIVDTVNGYNIKEKKPLAYIMVSKKTGSLLYLKTSSPEGWTVEEKFDQTRRIRDKFYMASKSLLQPMDQLLEVLRS